MWKFSLAVLLSAATPAARAADSPTPEAASGVAGHPTVVAQRDMVVAANPIAAAAGREILRRGGSAVDAAIATALVLNLVEPQSSGIGGGGFLVHWSAGERRITTFDGRETAPEAARPDRFLDEQGKPLPFFDAVVGGRSVGVPGELAMLELAHRRLGRLPWAALFAPAITLARQGFPISPRLHTLLAADRYLAQNEPARSTFYLPDGSPKPVGTILADPELASTLEAIARDGAAAFYRGPIAADIVAAVREARPRAGDLTLADLAGYEAKERPAVCARYREHEICGMGAPSSGLVTIDELLLLAEPFAAMTQGPSVDAWHLFAEASRLAYADRDRYLADPDFVPPPIEGLLSSSYLTTRRLLLDPSRAAPGSVRPGDPPPRHAADWGRDASPELPSTTNVAIVDQDGNALAMTVTIENEFGSRVMVRGFLLNNELTDFSFVPEDQGRPVANRVEPGKRPRSSMSPTIVFGTDGSPELVIGSAGGSAIITDVAKTIVAALDWGMDLEAAMALPNIGNRNGATEVEAGPAGDTLAAALGMRGHQVRRLERASGLTAIRLSPKDLEGAADPRREGVALGD